MRGSNNFGIYVFLVVNVLVSFSQAFFRRSPFEIDLSRSPLMYTSTRIIAPICHPQEIQSPTTTSQVLEIVRKAISKNLTVKAFGHRHSATDIICTDGIAIDMGNFKESIQMNSDYSVTASAGYTIREVGEFLHANGRSLEGGACFGEITIGGAIGTGAHGSSLNYKTIISDMMIEVEIVDGLGEIQKISSQTFLRAYRVHLGMLGILVRIRLKTVPDFKITGHHYEVSDEILTNGEWASIVRNTDYAALYWFPNINKVVVANGTIVPISKPGEAEIHLTPKTSTLTNVLFEITTGILQALKFHSGFVLGEEIAKNFFTKGSPGLSPIYSEDGSTLKNPATGYRYLMQDSICSPECAWQRFPYEPSAIDNSIFLDLADFEQVIQETQEILNESKAAFLGIGIFLRFVKASDSYLAPNYGRDTFIFEFNEFRRSDWYESPIYGISAFQTIRQALTFKYNGRSHWAKTGFAFHSREIIQRKVSRENRESFLTIREKVDPNRIFLNDFGLRLLDESNKTNTDPAITHCALEDNCFCKIDLDCADDQSCGHLPSFPDYNVCL